MIELPFPAKILWPNGRGHHMAKHRATKKHREWARLAALADRTRPALGPEDRAQLIVTVYPKTAHAIDDDNARAALKAYQDGIADALKVNDSRFAPHRLAFGEPVKGGKVVIGIEVEAPDRAAPGAAQAVDREKPSVDAVDRPVSTLGDPAGSGA